MFGEQQAGRYYSHEFRNLTAHEDWIGIEQPTTFSIYAFRDNFRWPADYFYIDYLQDGDYKTNQNWQQYYRGDDSLKANPRFNQKAFVKECFAKYNYSWEVEQDCIVGNKDRKSYDCNCDHSGCNTCYYSIFHASPTHERNWIDSGKWRKLIYTSEKKMKIGREMKSIRMRIGVGGQKGGGFEWWQYGAISGLGFEYRYFYVKSYHKDENMQALCMVDSNPQTNMVRGVYVISCQQAVKYNDTREIWQQYIYPNLMRLEGNERLTVESESNRPIIKPNVRLYERDSWWPQMNDHQVLLSYSKNKCVVLMEQTKKLSCGVNVTSEVTEIPHETNRAVVKNPGGREEFLTNLPCAPGLEEGQRKPFYFKIDGEMTDMYIIYKFLEDNTALSSVDIKWQKAPLKYVIECYDDYNQQWYISAFYFNKSKSLDHRVTLQTRICKELVIRIVELDPSMMECEKPDYGKCLIIDSIHFETGMRELFMDSDCKIDDSSAHTTRWYYEPADLVRNDVYQNVNIEYIQTQSNWLKEYIGFNRSYKLLRDLEYSFAGIYAPYRSDDLRVSLQYCEDATCMARVDPHSPPIKNMLNKITNTKNKFVSRIVDPQLGEGMDYPAESCSVIKAFDLLAPNGYYWVNNSCASEARKVYCRFDKPGKPEGVMITNDQDVPFQPVSAKHKISKLSDLLNACVKGGLDFTKVGTIQDLETIALLSIEYGYSYNNDRGIIVGYDFSCETQNNCSGDFRSLDGSVELSSILSRFSEKINKSFNPIRGDETVMLVNGTLKSMKLKEAKVVGVPCSTINELQIHPTSCKVTIKELVEKGIFNILCTVNCSESSYPIYGDQVIYSEDSAACKALMHSGLYETFNGIYYAQITTVNGLIQSFKGNKGFNDIKSFSKEEPGIGYMIEKQGETLCPNEKLKKTSFMQVEAKADDKILIQIQKLLNKLPEEKRNKILINNNNGKQSNLIHIQRNNNDNANNYRQPIIDNLYEKTNDTKFIDTKLSIHNKIIQRNNIRKFKNSASSHRYNGQKYNKMMKESIQDNTDKIIEQSDNYRDISLPLINNYKYTKASKTHNNITKINPSIINTSNTRTNSTIYYPSSNGNLKVVKYPSVNNPIFNESMNVRFANTNQEPAPSSAASPAVESEEPTHSIEFKYDSQNEKYYSNKLNGDEQDIEGNYLENVGLWLERGDDSYIYQNFDLKTIRYKEVIIDYLQNIKAYTEISSRALQFLAEDRVSLEQHQKLLPSIQEDFSLLSLFASSTARAAKKETKKAESLLLMVSDEYMSYFSYVGLDFRVPIEKGISIPLPDMWHIINPGYSSEEFSKVVVTKDPAVNLSPHSQAILIQSNPQVKIEQLESDAIDLNSQGVILISRYNSLFDGSFHFSFKAASNVTTVGAYFRYLDQFTHYGLKLDLINQEVVLFMNSPAKFMVIHKYEGFKIDEGYWYRVVIKFSRYRIKYWISNESAEDYETLEEGMSPEVQKKEYEVNGMVLNYDPSLKDGRVGIFANQPAGLLIANPQVYAEECYQKPPGGDSFLLLTPLCPRYEESFKPTTVQFKFDNYVYPDSWNDGPYIISDAPQRKAAIMNSKPTYNSKLEKGASNILIYKGKTFICIDMCIIKTSVRFDGNYFGNAMIGFKYKDQYDYYMLLIHKHRPKYLRSGKIDPYSSKVRLSRFKDGGPKSLQFRKVQNIKNDWMNIEIVIIKNKISVFMNAKAIFQDFIELDENTMQDVKDGINTKRGKLALGVNGAMVQFSDIKVTAVKPPKDIPTAIPSPEVEEDDQDTGEVVEDDIEDKEKAPVQLHEDCFAIGSREMRLSYCKKKFGDDSSACLAQFAEYCCLAEKYEKMIECITAVDSAKKLTPAPADWFNHCFNQDLYEPDRREDLCFNCCSESMDNLFEENSLNGCKKHCMELLHVEYDCGEGICDYE